MPDSKQAPMIKISMNKTNLSHLPYPFLSFTNWNLEFVWNLVLEIWNFCSPSSHLQLLYMIQQNLWDTFSSAGYLALRKVEDEGAAFVSFISPELDLEGKAVQVRDRDNYIVWNKDHTEAKLQIITYYGSLDAMGYDIHLRNSEITGL